MASFTGKNSSRAESIGRLENFYPSPFFDVASTYIPKTIKETFDWCLYYQLTNPIINSITTKMATYPITDLSYEDENPGIVDTLKELFENQLNLRLFLIETNLDRYTFGNSFTSISFPLQKMLKCMGCGEQSTAASASYLWKNFKFHLKCAKCDFTGPAEVKDEPLKTYKKIRLIRWNPKHIVIKSNEITGDIRYYYKIPKQLKNSIIIGKPEVIETIPQAFIDAVKKNKAIKIDSSKIFHSRRPSASRDPADSGWGTPLILPVLKDIFFLQILRKSQEAVSMEHIVPMRVLFPQITTDGSNPYQHVNLKEWQTEVVGQIKRWRRDINHIPVMPMPVGYQAIGGQGRALLLHQEVRIYSEQIIAGMGVPTGFFYGEAQYSGASINLRALENEFMGNRQDMLRLVEFLRDQICAYLSLPKPALSFKPFKMADDLQRAQFDFGLVQQQLLSKQTFMQSRDYDYDDERGIVQEEVNHTDKLQMEQTKAQAEAQGEGQVIATKYQIKSQEMMNQAFPQPQVGPDGQPVQPGQQPGQQQPGMEQPPEAMGGQSQVANMGAMAPLYEQAQGIATEIAGMDRVNRYKSLTSLKRQSPDVYMLVNQMLNQMKPGQGAMNPLPSLVPGREG